MALMQHKGENEQSLVTEKVVRDEPRQIKQD